MKLQHHHAESFISLTSEGRETGNRICQILTDMDALKSVQRIKPEGWVTDLQENNEQLLVKQAMSSVDYAEEAALELTEVVTRRKMSPTEEYLQLVIKAQRLGARLYRNLWELSLSDNDKKIMRNLIKRIASFSVWEDLPSTMAGRSYERVLNEMDGTIAFQHVYGVTFMQYKEGKASSGWTLLRDALEENVVLARSRFDLAADYMLPNKA
jgi:hypothetical protein